MGARSFQARPAAGAGAKQGHAATMPVGLRSRALAIAGAHDSAEREATTLANTAMGARHEAHADLATSPGPHHAERAFAPPSVHEVLASPGRPLDNTARGLFERRFGHDFSTVRIHSDARAATSAATVGADAYTVGSNIAFAQDRYRPHEEGGRRLIAHELAHVARHGQSRSNVLFRQTAAPTTWFGGPRAPANKQLADDNSRSDGEIKGGIAIEKPPAYTTISFGDTTKQMSIRFAFPSSEFSSGLGNFNWAPSSRITTAKTQIAKGFVDVVHDAENWNSSDPDDDRAKKQRQQRLTAMLTQFDKANPLNIFLSVNPQDQTPISNSITVDADKAATAPGMLIPTQMFQQMRMSNNKLVPTADADETKRTMLHETTHNSLIRSNADFAGVWRAHNMKLTPHAPNQAALANDFLTLARFFIIAQEEVFVYDTEQSLYPGSGAAGGSRAQSGSPQRSGYEGFIRQVTDYFVNKKQLKLEDVRLKVISGANAPALQNWTIAYKFPVGVASLHGAPSTTSAAPGAGTSASGQPKLVPPATAPMDDAATIDVLMTFWKGVHGAK